MFRVILLLLVHIPLDTATGSEPVCKGSHFQHVFLEGGVSSYQRSDGSAGAVFSGSTAGSCPRKATSLLTGWHLADAQVLLQTFPIDPDTRNFVRQVRNVLFSKVHPTPFRTPVKLAAFTPDVLANIFDLDPSVASTPEFVEVFSGNRVLPGAVPLAHRYGGHWDR